MLILLALSARADEEMVVESGEDHDEAAMSGSLTTGEVAVLPYTRSDELLRAIPGLHMSAHGGQGKAYQFFVRGFDAVHGADLAISLEGVPLNEVSNIHGHGYLDLAFIPRMLVTGLDWQKGSYRPERGDFAVAATADYRLGLARPGLVASASGGSDRTGSASVGWRPEGMPEATFLYADIEGGEGFGARRGYRMARAAAGAGGHRWRAFALAYGGTFESAGVIREPDLEAERISLWGGYPESGGGESSRVLGALEVGSAEAGARLWGGARTLTLRHNFTGYLVHETLGDGYRQQHDSGQVGVSTWAARGLTLGARTVGLRGGVDLRADQGRQTEDRADTDWQPHAALIDADFRQTDAAIWGGAVATLWPSVVVRSGLRVDHLRLSPTHRIDRDGEPVEVPVTVHASGLALSPKAGLRLKLSDELRLLLDWGRGFRSPTARGVWEDGAAPPTLIQTGEVGLQALPGPAWSLQSAAFATFIDDEIILDHTAGRFLATGRTRRLGAESAVTWQPWQSLQVRLDASYTDGRYTLDGAPVPFAPRLMLTGGLYAIEQPLPKGLLSGGLRTWLLGPRPLPDGFVGTTAWVTDLTATYTLGRGSISADVQNLLGRPWRDGEFVYASWFDRTQPRSELPVVNITAGTPPVFRLRLTMRL